MADNRKTFESTPLPATGRAPDPVAATGAAREGADVGGIPKTADSAVGESIGLTGDTPPVAPREGAAKDARRAAESSPAKRPAPGAQGESGEDETPLESLGKATGAPLSGEAAKEEPRR